MYGWLVWLFDWLTRLLGCLVNWLILLLSAWLVNWVADCHFLIVSLFDWLVIGLVDGLYFLMESPLC